MKNNRLLSVLTIILLIANVVTLTLLWTNNKSQTILPVPAPPTGSVFNFLTKELNLNQQQQQAYKLLRNEHQAGQRLLQDSLRLAKDALFELLKTPVVNEAVIKQASDKGVALQQQLELFTFNHFQKVRALCTTEQQLKFDGLIRQVLQQMNGGRRPGPPPGAGGEDGTPPFEPEGQPKGDRPKPPRK